MIASAVLAYNEGVEGTSTMDQACLAVTGATEPLEALLRCGGKVRGSMICQALYGIENQPEVAVGVVTLLLEHAPEVPQEAYDILEDAKEDFQSEVQQAAIDQIRQLLKETPRNV